MSAHAQVHVRGRYIAVVLCMRHLPVLRLLGEIYPTTEEKARTALHGCQRCYQEIIHRLQ